MNITVIGAGAIGGVIGAYLCKDGTNVQFVDINEDHVNAMKRNGLTISQKEDSFTIPVKACTLDELIEKGENLETVFLCVKALHTKDAVRKIKPLLGEDSYVISFQNGLCEYEIADEIGMDRTVGCFVNLFADYIEPGVIQYGGVGSLYIGEVDGHISPRVEKLLTVLSAWGEAKGTDNILGYLWSKLAYGALLAATATSNETIADFFENPKYFDLILNLSSEVLAIAEYKGIQPMGFDDWKPSIVYPATSEKEIKQQFHVLIGRLRGYTKTRTGIWRDLAIRKRKTEVPHQLNPVIAEGEKIGQNMTLTKKIVVMISEIENGERQLQLDNLDELLELTNSSMERKTQ